MTYFKFVGGSDLFRIFAERRQALGLTVCRLSRLPKGGQRRRGISSRLIDCIGGDSYGK